MKYLSVCSGIEAVSAAWHSLGFIPAAFAEIEKFPSAVLAHRFGSNMPGEPWSGNAPPNLGDITKFKEWPDYAIDLLVGGTPCQSFSVAGLRKGLADPRGNLALTYLAIADSYRPEWILWENVPGVLSSNGGRDFGAFLGGLAELGYGWAYRVLDAQYVRVDGFGRAVPQRRRRVFVVGCLGGWASAAAVLFDAASLHGDPAPRRQAGKKPAPTLSARTKGGGGLGTDFDIDGGLITARMVAFGEYEDDDTASTVKSRDYKDATDLVAHTLLAKRNSSHAADLDNYIAFPERLSGTQCASAENLSPSLGSANPMAVAYDMRGREGGAQFEGPHETANIRAASGGSSRSYVAQQWAVRRLTPLECERLQGFPDNWTNIPWRGKPAADGPRYKAIGNSMAVNVMRWIGIRLQGAASEIKKGAA